MQTSIDPTGKLEFVLANEDIVAIEVSAGVTGTLTPSVRGAILVGATGTLLCEKDLFELGLPAPGPAAGILSGLLEVSLILEGAVTGETGLGFSFELACPAQATVLVGTRYDLATGNFSNISQAPTMSADCTTSGGLDNGFIEGVGPEIKVQVGAAAGIKAAAGVTVGGFISNFIGTVIGNEDFGEVAPIFLQGTAGPEMVIETGARVLKKKTTEMGIGSKLELKGGLDGGILEKLFGWILPESVLSTPTLTVGGEIAAPSLISPPAANGAPTIRIDGAAVAPDANGLIEVPVDGVLTVQQSVPNTAPPISLALTNDFYTYEPDGSGGYTLTNLLDWSASGQFAAARLEMTEELCVDEFQSPRTFETLGYSGIGGVGVSPVFVGVVKIACDTRLAFSERFISTSPLAWSPPESESAQIELTRGEPSRTVFMKQSGLTGGSWTISDEGGNGALVTVTPSAGTFADDQVALRFELDCGADEESEGDTHYQAIVRGELRTARVDVHYDCSPNFISVNPDGVSPGGTIVIVSSGDEDDEWIVTGRYPGAVVSFDNQLAANESRQQDVLIVDPRDRPLCGASQPQSTWTLTLETSSRGSDSFELILPERNADDDPTCDQDDSPGGGGGVGDDDAGGSSGSGVHRWRRRQRPVERTTSRPAGTESHTSPPSTASATTPRCSESTCTPSPPTGRSATWRATTTPPTPHRYPAPPSSPPSASRSTTAWSSSTSATTASTCSSTVRRPPSAPRASTSATASPSSDPARPTRSGPRTAPSR